MSTVKIVQAKKTSLAVGISSAEASEIVLTRLVDIYGNALAMSDFGTILYITKDPGGATEEIISATGFTVNSDSSVSINAGIVRGLAAKYPYGSGGTASASAAGTVVVVSNNPQIYDSFVSNTGDESIEGVKTFVSSPVVPTPTTDFQAATKKYADDVATGGATYNKEVVAGTYGEDVTAGDKVYFKTSDQKWWKTDADAAATALYVKIGIAQETALADAAGTILTHGLDANQSGLVAGSSYYLSGTAGGISTTKGTNVRFVGVAKSATQLFFDPSTDPESLKIDGQQIYAADSVGTDAYAITLPVTPGAYKAGMIFYFKAGTANTGAATLNVNTLGAKTIKKNFNSTLADNDIVAGQIVGVSYDASNDCFQMTTPVAVAPLQGTHEFGDGSDGALAYDGSTTILGMAPSGSAYTLTRDIFATDLTISTGVTINTGGYKIYVNGTLTRNGTGKICNNGGAGGNGTVGSGTTAGTGGSAGSAAPGITVPAGTVGVGGGAGGAGNTSGAGSSGTAGTAGTAVTNALGVVGATYPASGGAGGASNAAHAGGSGAAGGAAGGVTASKSRVVSAAIANLCAVVVSGTLTLFSVSGGNGGAGGGGGGGGNSSAGGGGGGGGGSGGNGGWVVVFAKTILDNNLGVALLQAKGGTGGDGGAGVAGAANSGGGGGGGAGAGGNGGIVVLVYKSRNGALTHDVTGGSNGSVGAAGAGGSGGGVAGTAGATSVAPVSGVTVEIQIA